jgi:hypothetical protein
VRDVSRPTPSRALPRTFVAIAMFVGLFVALALAPAASATTPANGHAGPAHVKGHAGAGHPGARGSVAARAHSLVAAVGRAHSPAAQGRAALALMRALRVAVERGDGRVLVRGDVARHASLYDFELRALAAARARGERVPVADLAAALDSAGLHRPGGKLTAALLARGLAAGVRDAVRHPRATSSLAGLALRELGLADRPRVDLAKLRAGDALDPLQAELVLVGVAQMTYGRRAPASHGVGAHGSAAPLASASSAAGICDAVNAAKDLILSGGNDGLAGKLMKKVLVTIVKKSTLTTKQQKALKLAEEIVDGLHGAALALSVAVHGEPESVGPAHYNHAAGEHNVLQMRVRVEMLDDYGKALVKCGPLAGLKFPPKGGIPNVPMHWETTGLAKHGEVICGAGCTQTDQDGVATLTLALKGEPIPGYGLEREDTGVADAIASYQSAFGAGLGDPSFWAQFATPKYGGVRWHVTWHEPPNLSLRASVAYDETYEDQHVGAGPIPTLDGSSFWETAGSGGMHFGLGADIPLAAGPGPGSSPVWTGSGPLGWTTFAYDDSGQVWSCGDLLGPATIDDHGTDPSPGDLGVDAVSIDQSAGQGVSVVLHANRLPSYTNVETERAEGEHVSCTNGTTTERRDFESFLGALDGAEDVSLVSLAPSEGASDTYRITGWTPGPPSGGGAGVYAYRDLPFTDVDEWGQTWTGHLRLELYATPAP